MKLTLNNEMGSGAGSVVFIGLFILVTFLLMISNFSEDKEHAKQELAIYHQSLAAPKTFLEAFQTTHQLQRVKDDKVTEGSLHGQFGGGFFLGFGGMSGSIDGKSEQKWTIIFSWEYRHPTLGSLFLLDRLYLDQVMVQFANVETPTIEFNFESFNKRWLRYAKKHEPYCDQSFLDDGYGVQPLKFCQKFRVNAIIRCKPEHWPKNTQMPM